MEHVIAPGDRCRPAGIVGQIRGEERQPIATVGAGLRERRTYFPFAPQIPQRGTNLMPGAKQCQSAVAADETGTASDQNCAQVAPRAAVPARPLSRLRTTVPVT